MGKQIINRLKKTLAVLPLVFFVLLTGVATSAQASQLGCPPGYHPGPKGPSGLAICEPDHINYSSVSCYKLGYTSGYNDGARACKEHLGYIPDKLRKTYGRGYCTFSKNMISFNRGYQVGFQRGWMVKGCLV